MPTERKIQQVAELRELLEGAEIAIATAYQGMSVREQTSLRRTFGAQGLEVRVVKHTLLRRAADEVGKPVYAELLQGPTALLVSDSDPVSAAKAATQYRRTHPGTVFEVRGAVVYGRLVDRAYVEDLATVPPRDELVARIAGGLTGKIAEFAGLLQATVREFSGLVDARAKQLETGGAA